MNRFRWAGACATLLVSLAVGIACTNAADNDEKSGKPEPVVIPLGQIWAWQMPGTLDVRLLEPEIFGEAAIRDMPSGESARRFGESLTSRIRWATRALKENQQIQPGFAVAGKGREALEEACAIMEGKQEPRKSFPADSEVSVLFFSLESGWYIHLHEVKRQDMLVAIRLRFVPHFTKELTDHFALIPLGQLPAGKVEVKIVRSPMEKKFVEWGFKPVSKEYESQILCQPFRFLVAEPIEQ